MTVVLAVKAQRSAATMAQVFANVVKAKDITFPIMKTHHHSLDVVTTESNLLGIDFAGF